MFHHFDFLSRIAKFFPTTDVDYTAKSLGETESYILAVTESRVEKKHNTQYAADLVFVCGRNIVVFCSQVGRGGDEVHVQVRVVVLLELERNQLQLERLGRRDLTLDLLQLVHVCNTSTKNEFDFIPSYSFKLVLNEHS